MILATKMEMTQGHVLIVGAGPTGLVLAISLARRGVPLRIIDRNSGPGQASRAMAVQARTLEFYRQFGFAEEMVARGIQLNSVHLREKSEEVAMLTLGNVGEGVSPFPFILSFPQDDHERFLTQQLDAMGIAVEWGVELREFDDEGAQVRCVLRREGAEEHANFAYLCGCDGASSTVRRELKLEFAGGTYDNLFYVADVEIAGEPAPDFVINLGRNTLVIMLPVRSTGAKRLIGIVPAAMHGRTDLTFDDVRPL
ncbi:MAG: FAD-dependent monooxygenase, partial [Granulicella sp.]